MFLIEFKMLTFNRFGNFKISRAFSPKKVGAIEITSFLVY